MRQSPVLQLMVCFFLLTAQAQSPSSSKFSPQGAYDQATRPLDITRRSPQNWSEVELAALKIATDQANTDCASHSPDQFTGEDLLAYARLCALGQDWKPVQEAAANYLNAQNAIAPVERVLGSKSLAIAFDYEVQASLRLKDPVMLFVPLKPCSRLSPTTNSHRMLPIVLFTTFNSSIPTRRSHFWPSAKPILLSLIRAHVASNSPTPSSFHPAFSLHALYADAIAFPAMQQFANQLKAGAAAFTELEATLPISLSPDDTALITETRRQYLLLGSHLPTITTFTWLPDPAAVGIPPELNANSGSATVLLLFPDWCNPVHLP